MTGLKAKRRGGGGSMDRSGQALNNSNIVPSTRHPPARAPARRRGSPLPAFALYGEPQRQGLGDLLHCESIAHRSRLHGWEIRPHRHESMFQILVIRHGRVRARLDADECELAGPCAITVPALTAHGFGFSPEVDGVVFTIVEQHLQAVFGGDAAWRQAVMRLRAWRLDGDAVSVAASALQADFEGHDRWRAQAVDSALRRLLLALARAAPPDTASPGAQPPRALAHVQRLRALVEAQFRHQPTLAALAAEVGVTPTQLNRVCHQVLGHSALGVLHGRLLLEAQRDLAYTSMSIKQVALGLGFGDAGYFTRFFQRLTGQTPSAWRARSG